MATHSSILAWKTPWTEKPGGQQSMAGSVAATHGFSCPMARGIFSDSGSNQHPLHGKADSSPLDHQGSPQTASLTLLLALAFSSIGLALC